MTGLRWFVWPGVVVALLMGFARDPLWAQGPRTPEDRAAELASQGVALFQKGLYNEALTRFLDSYETARIPEVIWNIGRCYEELGDLGSALRYFEEFQPLAPDEAARRKARAKIEEIRSRIKQSAAPVSAETVLVVSAEDVEVPEARILVDGREVHRGPLPARVPLEPGQRRVEVSGGEGVEPVSRTLKVAPGGIAVVVLRPLQSREAEPAPMAGHARDRGYCDPFLFPSSRMGFAAGGEFSPVFARGNPFKVLSPDLPTQTFAGLYAQAGGERFGVTIRGGRWSRVPSWLIYPTGKARTDGVASWNLHKPFQRAGLEIKVRTSASPVAWSTLVFDLDYRHLVLSETTTWLVVVHGDDLDDGPSDSRNLHSLQWLLAEAFGFTIADRVTLEFWLGIAFLIPEADASDGWKRGLSIAFPMAGRTSVRVVDGGHVDLEARWPLVIGPMSPREGSAWSRAAGIQADMAVGYRHVFDEFQVGGAVVFALNRFDQFGREKVWLLLTGQYQF